MPKSHNNISSSNQNVLNHHPTIISSYETGIESQIDPEIILCSILSQTPPPYQLTLRIDDLLTSHPKSNSTIPRPKNSFILFRKDYNAKIKIKAAEFPKMTVGKTSSIISQAWKNQPPSVLQFFEILSLVENKRHKIMYPNYKYNPQKKEKGNKIKIWQNPFVFIPVCDNDIQHIQLQPIVVNSSQNFDFDENMIDHDQFFITTSPSMETSIESNDKSLTYENFTAFKMKIRS